MRSIIHLLHVSTLDAHLLRSYWHYDQYAQADDSAEMHLPHFYSSSTCFGRFGSRKCAVDIYEHFISFFRCAASIICQRVGIKPSTTKNYTFAYRSTFHINYCPESKLVRLCRVFSSRIKWHFKAFRHARHCLGECVGLIDIQFYSGWPLRVRAAPEICNFGKKNKWHKIHFINICQLCAAQQ